MKKIGLTGGIGAGKSTVAIRLQQAGIPVLNLDHIGKEMTENDPKIIAEIKRLGGWGDQTFDRKMLREMLFANPQIRKAVEKFLHPLILEEFERQTRQLANQGKKMVICEAALIIEGNYHHALDGLIVVMAPESVRRQRLMERDGISAELANQMIGAQTSDQKRLAAATLVLNNLSTKAELEGQISPLLTKWRKEGLLD